jgi:hypothetical protein
MDFRKLRAELPADHQSDEKIFQGCYDGNNR